MHRMSVSPASLFIALCLASAAGAQAPTLPPPQVACHADIRSTCASEFAARSRSGVRACLIKNFNKLSPDCQASMKAVQAREAAGKGPPPKP